MNMAATGTLINLGTVLLLGLFMTRSCRSLVAALLRAFLLLSLLTIGSLGPLDAQTLSTTREINFYRDVPSRSLKGLAARSDGVLLNGPHISTLDVVLSGIGADLLWSAVNVGQTVYLGTGPEGLILSFQVSDDGVTLNPTETISLPHDSHLLALAAFPDGSLLVGSSPEGALNLIKDSEVIARTALPVGSILAIEVNATYEGNEYALVATGSPARIYRVNLVPFRESGVHIEKLRDDDADALAECGIELWGTVRDEAIRSLLRLPDGRVIAGSAPKGNVYEFKETGGSPRVLSENANTEVTSLLAWEGGFFATLTTGDTGRRTAQLSRSSADNVRPLSSRDSANPSGGEGGGGSGESGENEASGEGEQNANRDQRRPTLPTPAANAPKFSGSSRLLWFPDGGSPETAGARQGVGFYQLARHGDLVLITAGDEGELLGYDPKTRLGMVFAGATAAQVNGILRLPVVPPTDKHTSNGRAGNARTPIKKGAPDSFLLIGNNPASLELMRFDCGGGRTSAEGKRTDLNRISKRSATTRRIDLGSPAELGALRFPELSDASSVSLQVELRTSESSDPLEGWGRWEPTMQSPFDMLGYRAEYGPLRGRYVQFRFTAVGPDAHLFEAESPRLYLLPQNQRPQLTNFAILPLSNARNGTDTLRKLAESTRGIGYREDLAAASDTPLHRTTRVIVWDLSDPNDDALLSTLSIRGPHDTDWQPVLVDSEKRYAVFNTDGLEEGRYRTRLEVRETAPRPADQRLSVTFEGEPFVIDHSPPEILTREVTRTADGGISISLVAQDLDSLLLGAEVRLNNGNRYEFIQTLDGILDGKRETFVLELSADEVGSSTHLEATVIDTHYNATTHRIAVPPRE